MPEPDRSHRSEASLSSIALPSTSAVRRAAALLAIGALLGLLCSAWWYHTRAHAQEPEQSSFLASITEEPLARRWSGFVLIPEAAPPLTPAEQFEARLHALAQEVERVRTRVDGPLIAFEAESLREKIERIIARVDDRAQVSVHVRDLESGRVVFDYYGDTLLNPASNHKVLTTSAALDLLGPDYVFETRVILRGQSLYLVGEGDPTIDPEALAELAQAVAERVPAGSLSEIVVDDSAFSPQMFGPGYADDGWGASYMAPSGALSVNFNTVEITVYRRGKSPVVRIVPESSHVVVDNRASLGKSTRLELRSHRELPRGVEEPTREQTLTRVTIAGTLAKTSPGYKDRRRVVDPGMFTGGAFARMLAGETQSEALPVRIGVAPRLDAELRDDDYDDEHVELPRIAGRDAEGQDLLLVAIRRSPPLIDIVSGLLTYSNNFMAEQILRTLGWRMSGDPGDWDNGSAVIRGYWAALGNDPDALVFENGSGLSARGRVTTAGLVELMAVAAHTQDPGASLFDALPVAGRQGTVRTRLQRSGKRVRAKTGTLDGVSGLTGVITSEQGLPQVAFSILINVRESDRMAAATRRSIEDRIVMTVLEHIDDWEAVRSR